MKILHNPDLFVKNTEKKPEAVNIDKKTMESVEIITTGFTYECPAHSLTSFKLKL